MKHNIPIVFAFDNNLAMPAAVCFYSMFVNAKPATTYQVYVMHRKGEALDTSYIDKVFNKFPMHSLKLIEVDGTFDSGYEVRGITTPTYYRLLIPELIPEHDKVIYSDVDVIIRQDLSEVYHTDLGSNILSGVNNLAYIDRDLCSYYEKKLGLNPHRVLCAGFLIMNLQAMRLEGLVSKFLYLSKNKYKYQDQDVLNIACAGRIMMLEPKYSLLAHVSIFAMIRDTQDSSNMSISEIEEALCNGNIHYNGQKPWRGWCLNFDIWWEYYRKSPVFDEEFYFKFYYNRLEELDTLPLMKRVKNLLRYFVYGRRKQI